ncbi:recombination protein NinG, partial [Salmonella enterica subsp. enterica]
MAIERKPAKPKKCRVATCRASFVPSRMGQAVCSPACAMIDAPRNEQKAKKAIAQRDRREIKVRKEKLKTRGDH